MNKLGGIVKTVSNDAEEQILLLQKKFNSLFQQVKALKDEKSHLKEKVRTLEEENTRLNSIVGELQEQCKRDEIRREAAETVLKAAKVNMNFDSRFEFVIFND